MKHARRSVFLDTEEIYRRRKREKFIRIVLINISIIIGALLFCVGLLFAYPNSVLADMLIPKTIEPTATPSPYVVENEVEANLINQENTATLDEEVAEVTPSPSPTEEPYIHPGIRDNKFTDGSVIYDDMSYHSSDLSIEITIKKEYESVFYIADVYFSTLQNFVPVFANNQFDGGYQTTSDMALENDAIFAVNSDSATSTDYGILVRNQEIYRDVLAADHLAIFSDGSMKTYSPYNISAEFLIGKGAEHVFCFGPRLFTNDGNVVTDFKYSHIRSTHPRTAIGMIEPYHYVFVVVDGRSDSYSEGVTLEELSQFMKDLGCTDAYNLDGGGSSTMIFMNKLINLPEGGTEERLLDSAIIIKEIDAGDN